MDQGDYVTLDGGAYYIHQSGSRRKMKKNEGQKYEKFVQKRGGGMLYNIRKGSVVMWPGPQSPASLDCQKKARSYSLSWTDGIDRNDPAFWDSEIQKYLNKDISANGKPVETKENDKEDIKGNMLQQAASNALDFFKKKV